MGIKYMTVHMEQTLLEKIRRIAEYEERSLNRHVVLLIKKHIREFEKSQGPIELPEE